MLDDLGNAQGFGDSKVAVLRYDRAGRLATKAGFAHRFYRLGLHPLGREFIAMSADCVAYAYDDDLRLLWRTTLADAPQIQALRRRLAICDEWLKHHIRCVAFARDRSRYLFTAVDEAWCVDLRGEAIWGLKLPPQDGWSRFAAQAGASVEVRRALAVLELALPVTPPQIKTRYRELAMRWHPDRNDSAQAHEQMTALNSAVELLSGIDTRILSGEGGPSCSGDEVTELMTFGFAERLDADWIYAADFAAHSNNSLSRQLQRASGDDRLRWGSATGLQCRHPTRSHHRHRRISLHPDPSRTLCTPPRFAGEHDRPARRWRTGDGQQRLRRARDQAAALV